MCLKGVSEVSKKDATHRCAKCKAYSDEKSHLCKPEKLKKPKADKKSKGAKKGKRKDKGKSAKKSAAGKGSKKKGKKGGK